MRKREDRIGEREREGERIGERREGKFLSPGERENVHVYAFMRRRFELSTYYTHCDAANGKKQPRPCSCMNRIWQPGAARKRTLPGLLEEA